MGWSEGQLDVRLEQHAVRTDLIGANAIGLRCLFVTRGIHSGDFDGLTEIDDATVTRLFGTENPPFALTRELRW